MSVDHRTAEGLAALLDALDRDAVIDRDVARSGLTDLVDRVGEAVVHLLEMVEQGAPLTVALSHPALADVLALCGLDGAGTERPATAVREVPVQISARPRTRCDLCGAERPETGHAHVADVEERRLRCVCDACRVLFADQRDGRFRTVPVGDPRHVVAGAAPDWWDGLDVPVGVVLLFHHAGHLHAAYPGPAGVVDAAASVTGVPEDLWPAAEVEALLAVADQGRFDAWIVPVTTAYELAGRLRDEHVLGDPMAAVRLLVDGLSP